MAGDWNPTGLEKAKTIRVDVTTGETLITGTILSEAEAQAIADEALKRTMQYRRFRFLTRFQPSDH